MLYQVRGEIVTFPTELGTLIAKERILDRVFRAPRGAPAKRETGSSDDAMHGGSIPIRSRPGQRSSTTLDRYRSRRGSFLERARTLVAGWADKARRRGSRVTRR